MCIMYIMYIMYIMWSSSSSLHLDAGVPTGTAMQICYGRHACRACESACMQTC